MDLIFTEDIIKDPKRFLEHLNLLIRGFQSIAVQSVAETNDKVVAEVGKMVPGAGIRFDRVLGELRISSRGIEPATSTPGSGINTILGYSKAVTGAGTAVFDIAEVGTLTDYIVDGFLLTAAGDKTVIVPQIPPLTDLRTATGFAVEHYETGTIYLWLVPINGVIGINQTITVPGTKTITFAARSSLNYLIDGFLLTAAGDKVVITPQMLPLTDTRALTSVDVAVPDVGELYVWILPLNDVVGIRKTVAGAGMETLTFPVRQSANYLVDGFVLTAGGDKSLIVPQLPPLSDTRTTIDVDVQVYEAGELYAWLVNY